MRDQRRAPEAEAFKLGCDEGPAGKKMTYIYIICYTYINKEGRGWGGASSRQQEQPGNLLGLEVQCDS